MTRDQENRPLLSVKQLTKSYGDHRVLDGVDLSVTAGQVQAIMGPSGSGKSSMLRLIALLEHADSGEIWLGDRRLGVRLDHSTRPLSERRLVPQRRDIGMVFQRFNLFPHMTAAQNVASGLSIVEKYSRRAAHEAAMAMLDRVALTDRADAYPSELSGGQQQRVAIARALVLDPKIMLFDEPTASLDPELVSEVLSVMEDLARGGMTMLVVTHEARFARNVADRVLMFDGGRILESAPPEQFFDAPEHERTVRFLSRLH